MVKSIIVSLLVVLSLLEYRFWFSKDSVLKLHSLEKQLSVAQQDYDKLQNRNRQLAVKIANLKKYPLSIEEQARYELGMIKPNEQYYRVVEPIK